MISAAAESLYSKQTDVMQFLVVFHIMNKGYFLQIQTDKIQYLNYGYYSESYFDTL